MNVLVVGGAGYVGGAVTDLLAETDHSFRVYDELLYEESYRKPVDFVYGDVRDHERLKPHLDWADAVVWLAALVGDPACALNPDISVSVNQQSVKWLEGNFDGRIVFMSTCSVYGARTEILDETSPTNPLSVYAVTKLKAEEYLSGTNAAIFRLGTLFGIGDIFSRIRIDLVVNTLTVRAHRLGRIEVYGGDQFRPLLHVVDAARTIVDNLETKHVGIFNLHSENVRIIDLAFQMKTRFPNLIIDQIETEFQDTRNYRVSSHKAESELGFSPTRNVDQGVAEFKVLLESGRIKDINNPRYTNQTFLSLHNTHVGGHSVREN